MKQAAGGLLLAGPRAETDRDRKGYKAEIEVEDQQLYLKR